MIGDFEIMRRQALFPYGPGAIINSSGESYIMMDISNWHTEFCQRIDEKRLEKHLRIDHIYAPPISGSSRSANASHCYKSSLPIFRFPKWLFCPSCRKLEHYTREVVENGQIVRPKCTKCQKNLVPMRFIQACEDGHIQDVPWNWYVHATSSSQCKSKDHLYFKTESGGAGGLDSLYIECRAPNCGCRRNLADLSVMEMSCKGITPWRDVEEECDKKVKVLQRGASNLRFDFSSEAISIPPYSDFDPNGPLERNIRELSSYITLKEKLNNDPENQLFIDLLVDHIASDLRVRHPNITHEKILSCAENELAEVDDSRIHQEESLIVAEYKALIAPDKVDPHPKDMFIKRNVDLSKTSNLGNLNAYISKVSIVEKLRNVRVYRGFSRIRKDFQKIVEADKFKSRKDWLPGVECFGEGFFISLDFEKLDRWSDNNLVKERVKELQKRCEKNEYSLAMNDESEKDAIFILLHTLAHQIMLRLEYISGYSASSVRERIYYDKANSISGILIYTADGDQSGSMGGICIQGELQNLLPLMQDAIIYASYCSNDPVCSESYGQGLDNLNLSACMNCSYVPESSCSYNNLFLDRQLLINESYGFFYDVLLNELNL